MMDSATRKALAAHHVSGLNTSSSAPAEPRQTPWRAVVERVQTTVLPLQAETHTAEGESQSYPLRSPTFMPKDPERVSGDPSGDRDRSPLKSCSFSAPRGT